MTRAVPGDRLGSQHGILEGPGTNSLRYWTPKSVSYLIFATKSIKCWVLGRPGSAIQLMTRLFEAPLDHAYMMGSFRVLRYMVHAACLSLSLSLSLLYIHIYTYMYACAQAHVAVPYNLFQCSGQARK